MENEAPPPQPDRTSLLVDSLTRLSTISAEVRELNDTVAENKRSQDRFKLVLVGLVAMFVAQITGLWFLSSAADDAKQAAEKAEDLSFTLNDCLLAEGKCYKNLASRGQQGTVRQMRFSACMLIQLPEDRTRDSANDCARLSFPEIPDIDLFGGG